jgi:AcrR family transcriptional regulator
MAVKPTGRPRGRPRADGVDAGTARRLLLEAAARVFTERGYRGATVDAIIAEAGLSKGAFYWHFSSKEELFHTLLEERIERPIQDLIELLHSAPADQDMAPEASQRFLEVLERERDTILLDHEYWSLATRDPKLCARYAKRQAELRSALAKALEARAEHLGAPRFSTPAEEVATAYLALANGLALAKIIDSEGVPDHLLGEMYALIYAGLVARAQEGRRLKS